MSKNITAYLCKEPWTPSGICSGTSPLVLSYSFSKETEIFEIEAGLCPKGYECKGQEITVYILPEEKDPIDCLLCIPACEELPFIEETDLTSFRLCLLEKFNWYRATHPANCVSEALSIDRKLNIEAQWRAEDMAEYNYIGNRDHFGRDISTMLRQDGMSFVYATQIAAKKQYEEEIDFNTLCDEFAQEIFATTSNCRQICNSYNQIGIGLAKKIDTGKVEYYLVVVLVNTDKSPELSYVPKPSLLCTGECVEKVHYQQHYREVSGWNEQGEFITRKEPLPYIDFSFPIPPICSLEKIKLSFELSPCSFEFSPQGKGSIKDNSLKFVWNGISEATYKIEHNKITVTFPLETTCFVPGEWIAVYAWLKGYENDCNPFLVAWNWFETPCWTSGIIQGCGLLDPNTEEVIDGGYLQPFKYSYVGDDRLHYLVLFKGSLFWIKPADFAEYKIGDRVFIHKDGLSFWKHEQVTIQDPACRFPIGENCSIPQDTILSDANVSYFLDKTSDVIVPQTFYGYGG